MNFIAWCFGKMPDCEFIHTSYSMPLAVNNSAQTRATPLASQINAGAEVMVKGAWNEPFKDECRLFTNGKYDDHVDGAARAFNALLHPQAGIFT